MNTNNKFSYDDEWLTAWGAEWTATTGAEWTATTGACTSWTVFTTGAWWKTWLCFKGIQYLLVYYIR